MRPRVFLYEHFSCADADDGADTAALRPAGASMRDAIAADLRDCEDCRVTIAFGPADGAAAAAAGAVRRRAGQSAAAFVAAQSAACDACWVVAPESDGVLARLNAAVDPARWIGCSAAAIRVASGKTATLRALAGAGVATPLAFGPADGIDRWVVKPDDGVGARATRVHASLDAARSDATGRAGAAAAVEAWIDGPALSLSLLCGDGAPELLSINRQQLAIDGDGLLSFVGVENVAIALHDPRAAALREMAGRVGAALPGLAGFVGVDLVWHARRGPVAIEVNPRVTSAYVGLSRALRRNLAARVVAAWRRTRLAA